jgi:uncharacterized protein (DUF1501 family)
MSKHICDRRSLLQLGGVTALASALPLIGRGRRAIAAPGPQARARRLLIINFAGGIRASAAFHASPEIPYNPYGLMTTPAGPFALGRMLDDTPPGMPPMDPADYVMGPEWSNAAIPPLRAQSNRFSVLGTFSLDRGDHLRARIEEPTGSPSGGDPGILTRIAAGFTEAAAAMDAPPFHLQPSALFGAGQGEMTTHVPVSLAGYYSLPSAGSVDGNAVRLTGRDFVTSEPMRDAFDLHKIERRHSIAGLIADTMYQHRRAARVIGARLAQDDMAVANQALRSASLGTVDLGDVGGSAAAPLTNGMLYDLMVKTVGPATNYRYQAINAGLAVRLLQLGSPAVCLELGGFDFHSEERTQGPPIYNFTGRLWSTLRWLLPRIPDPSGDGSLYDRTLVVTMSDFGRDRVLPTGFNGGDGSDHGADFACFYLSHAVMGAGTTENRLVGPVNTATYDARNESIKYTSDQLLVTLLDALGLDAANEAWGFPTGGAPIAELWA